MSSRVAELARAEADRAEVDEPNEEESELGEEELDGSQPGEPDESQPAEPAEQPQPPTDAQIEALVKAWERERDRHMRELSKRDADRYAVSEVCPLCDGHGVFFRDIPEPDATFRRQYIEQALGGAAEPDYLEHPDVEPCDTCGALGELRTGSKVPGQERLPCRACNGQGHKPKLTLAPQPAQIVTPVQPVAPPPVQPGQVGPLDPWQRPVGHPHYNIPPAQVGA